jgi:membrane protease subunit (stomatin/prohibitin family)
MPYGQEFQNQSLAQAMANQQNLVRQQQAAQALSQGGTGAGGLAGILGAALGGVMAGRKGKQIAEGEANINEQLAQYQNQLKADQAQKEAQALQGKVQSLVDSGLDPQKASLVAQGLAPYSAFQPKAEDVLGNKKHQLNHCLDNCIYENE